MFESGDFIEYPVIDIRWKHIDEMSFNELYDKLSVVVKSSLATEIVGVVCVSTHRRIIPIVLDDEMVRKVAYFAAFLTISINDFPTDFEVIAIDSFFYTELLNDIRNEATIYHEIGHLECGHSDEEKYPIKQVKKEREKCLEEGTVYFQEYEADKFASYYLGQEAMVEYFDLLGARLNKYRKKLGLTMDGVSTLNREIIQRKAQFEA